MRLLFSVLFYFLIFCSASAQSSAFVLVDVSGSGPNDMNIRRNAKLITEDLINGKFNANAYLSGWKWSNNVSQEVQDLIDGKGKPMINPNQDGYLMIMPFGEKNTYRKKQIAKIQNLSRELSPFFNAHFPTIYDDNYTYIDLAEAMAASYAKSSQVGITRYYLITVTDNLQDTDSRGPNYTAYEQDVIDTYGTKSITDTKIGTLRYTGGNGSNFQISLSIVKINKSNTLKPISPGTAGVKKNLSLTNPVGGTRKNPKKMSGNSITVMWKCLGCDSLLTFRANLAPVGETSKLTKAQNQKTSGNSATFNLDASGVYKILVTAPGLKSRASYVEVKGNDLSGDSGGGGFFPILLLLLLLGGGYYFYTKNKREETPYQNETTGGYKPPTQRKPDIQSGGDSSASSGGDDMGTF